jgi:hypothetical protein
VTNLEHAFALELSLALAGNPILHNKPLEYEETRPCLSQSPTASFHTQGQLLILRMIRLRSGAG